MNYDEDDCRPEKDEYRPEKAIMWLFVTVVIGSVLIVWLR